MMQQQPGENAPASVPAPPSPASLFLSFMYSKLALLPLLFCSLALCYYLLAAASMPPATLVFLAVLVLQVLIALFSYLQSQKGSRESEIELELAQVVADLALAKRAKEAHLLGAVEQREIEEGLRRARQSLQLREGATAFVVQSKLERKHNDLEKERDQLLGKQAVYIKGKKQAAKAPVDYVKFLTYSFQPIVLLTLLTLLWSTPMLLVAPEFLAPAAWLFLGKQGLGITSWLFVCHNAVSVGVRALAASLGLAPKEQKSVLDNFGLGFLKPFVASVLG